MRDAASKLLLVPARGNRAAERAASSLNIPTATVSVSWTDGETTQALRLPLPHLELQQPVWKLAFDLPVSQVARVVEWPV